MEQGIATSDIRPQRTVILITLNVLGVIICVFGTLILVLWALKVIFPEPNAAQMLLEFISYKGLVFYSNTSRLRAHENNYADDDLRNLRNQVQEYLDLISEIEF